jgi:mRNA interferase MazF
VEQTETLSRGGIYLAKLNPAKAIEIGKVRPVIILNSQAILNSIPPIVFICPLSSQSQPEFSSLHFELSVRDNLKVKSYALVEHCRSIVISRIIYPRIAQTTSYEIESILHKLQRLVGLQ